MRRKRKKQKAGFLVVVLFFLLIAGLMTWLPKENESAPIPIRFPMAEFPPLDSMNTTVAASAEEVAAMRGVWISYLEFESILMGKTEDSFRKSLQEMFENCVEFDLNTVIVQVRSHGDAYYPSTYYPWSMYATGTVGKPPAFDPFAVILEEAKKQDLSVHAWINPYRLSTEQHMQELPRETPLRMWYDKQQYMKKQDGYYYLDPGSKEVQDLIINGVKEIIENYLVDGIQIDDYFYLVPPAVFDQSEAEARKYTTQLVQGLHNTVKEKNKELVFGISPMGNFKELPISDTEQYTALQAWCEKGYVDYLAPQIYWDFGDTTAPFAPILKKWEAMLSKSQTKLYVGLASYKFNQDTIDNQIDAVMKSKVATGYMLFRYDYLVE